MWPLQPGSDIAGLSEWALDKRKANAMQEDGDDDNDNDDVSRALEDLVGLGLASMDLN